MKSFFLKNKKRILVLASFFVLISIFLFFPELTRAAEGEGVAKVLGWIIYPIILLLGKLAVLLLELFVRIAKYNDFINSSAVTYGWIIVRDLCNMFFVLILLIIAFATILRVESYNLKTWLPKLVIMAILINFSKLICGVFIDFTQVIMLTFVNAFKDIAGGNLTHMLGLTDILNFSQDSTEAVTAWSILGSIILALIFVIIATVVILTMLVMLVMRMVMIWIYVVLSPLAYLLASFPQGQSYSQRWWSDFSKNLIIGPVLAFFIWLSFASLGGVGSVDEIKRIKGEESFSSSLNDDSTTATSTAVSAAMTEAGSADNMIKFIVSIGMLLGGLMIAQEMGGMAGKVAGKGMAKLQAMGSGALKTGKRVTGIERAENAIKSYKQQKESKRQDLAQRDAGSLLKAEGKTKKAVAYIPQKAGSAMGNLVRSTGMFGSGTDKQMKEQEAKIKKKEQGRDFLKENIGGVQGDKDKLVRLEGEVKMVEDLKNKTDNLESAQTNYKNLERDIYNGTHSGTKEEAEGRLNVLGQNLERAKVAVGLEKNATDDETLEKIVENKSDIQEKETSLVGDYSGITGKNVSGLADIKSNIGQDITAKDDELTSISGEIESQEVDIEKDYKDLDKKRKRSEKVNKWSSVITGGAIGAIIGGGIPGALIGGVAGGVGRKRLKHAGEGALDLASNHNSSQIGKYKDKFKDEKDEKLRENMNNYSLSGHERTAATMVLMERGELSSGEAKTKSDQIRDTYKNDSKVMSQLDGALNNNYQNMTQVFSDLHSGEPEKSAKAQDKIVKGVVSGTIKVDGINDQASLDLVMPKLAGTITPKNFKNIYDSQTVEKRGKIKSSLNKTNSSLHVLASIDGDLGHFGADSAAKTKYLEGAGLDQFSDLSSSVKGLESIKNWLNETGKLTKIQNMINQGKTDAVLKELNNVTKNIQFNKQNNIHRGIVTSIENYLKRT